MPGNWRVKFYINGSFLYVELAEASCQWSRLVKFYTKVFFMC